MSEIKKINKAALILHTIPLMLLMFAEDYFPPTWFDAYVYPEEVFSTVENIIFYILWFPILCLFALWTKSLFNTVIPSIFDLRKISFWEAYGIMILVILLNL